MGKTITAHARVQQLLIDLRSRAKAKSTVLYVRDAVQPHYMRMVAQDGVLTPELMYGPLLRASRHVGGTANARQSTASQERSIREIEILAELQDELHDVQWFDDSDIDKFLVDDVRDQIVDHGRIANDKADLIGGYAHREKVKSALLIKFYDNDERCELIAALWINFDTPWPKCPHVNSVRSKKKAIRKVLPTLINELASGVSKRLTRFRQIHRAAKQFPRYDDKDQRQHARPNDLLTEYLDKFLHTIICTLGIGESGFGSIYLKDHDDNLQMFSQGGNLQQTDRLAFAISDVGSLVSWAAIQKSPLLIHHPSDRFGDFYVNLYEEGNGHKARTESAREPINSELIVPLMIDDEVLGVINLEAESEDAFENTDAFDLTAAARYVALCIQVLRQTEFTYEKRAISMLELASDAADEMKCVNIRERLQIHACSWMKAARCNIWEIDSDGAFVGNGVGVPRKNDGYSVWIRDTRQPIWLQCPDLNDKKDVSYKFWNSSTKSWENYPNSPPEIHPDKMNGDATRNQLGIPIVFRDVCIAVMWFKFETNELLPLPMKETMGLARYLAAEVALILAIQDRHTLLENQQSELDNLANTHKQLFPRNAISFCGIEGYVISEPCGPIGGDFYRHIQVHDNAGCFIVGDGKGHGLPGACHMLPLLTAVNASLEGKRFISPRSLLCDVDKLVNQQDTMGTAICLVIDRSRTSDDDDKEESKMHVASAGHDGFMFVKRNRSETPFKERGSGQAFGYGESVEYGNGMIEKEYSLDVGDLIVVFSDGVTDAGEQDSTGFGFPAVKGIVERMINDTPEAIALEIEAKLQTHASGRLADDYTVMVLKIGELAD